jgi:tetratricopeptide (TPR) repeat protein
VTQPALTTCSGCGLASQLHEAFQSEPNSIRRFCPPCWKRRDEANERIYLITYVCLGVLGIVLAAMNSHWGFLLLTFFLFHVFGILGTLPHELGHAFAARALNLHVFQVVVGVGKRLFECRIVGVLVEFRTIPYGGFTLALPLDAQHFRIRHFVYALAGPVANLVVALIVLAVVGWDRIADFRPHEKISPWSLLFASNALIFLSNLVPRAYPSATGWTVSDGLHLIRSLTLKKEDVDHLRAAAFAMHWSAAREKGDMRSATAWIDRGLQEFPQDRPLRTSHGINLLEAGRFDEARAQFEKLLHDTDADDIACRALLMSNIAYVDALIATNDFLQEADEYSEHALKVFPWSAAIKGTRGTVFVQRGQLPDGIALLQHSLAEAEERWGRAQNACLLTMAEARRGNFEAAANYLQVARELQPDCFLIARAERSINERRGQAA